MKPKAVLAIVLTLLTITTVGGLPPLTTAASTSFTFTASGDLGSLTATTGASNLNRLQATGSNFFLSLGDMSNITSVGSTATVTGDIWCSQFKTRVNNIEILPGDHDTGGHPPGFFETHSYEKYLNGCPYNLNSGITCGPIEGECYGKEYYFDYPATNPLARIILSSPKIYNITGQCTTCCSSQCTNPTQQSCNSNNDCWTYTPGNPHYNWISNAIDNARNRGIRWIIVATHKACISASDATCSIGVDFYNLLLSKKVDLIIEAHDDAYERSKQMALNPSTCTSIVTDGNGFIPYNPGCIVDDGSRGYYTPGMGSVTVIQGAWVNDLYGVGKNATQTENQNETPYFASLMGSGTSGAGLGFVQYTVAPDRIDVQTKFSSSFQDNFSIWGGPSPLPFAMWNPSNPQAGQIVTFNGTVIGGTAPYSLNWNFGDGTTAQGSVVTHLYTNPRTYNVTLTASDANNTIGTTRRTITVGSWNPAVGCSPTTTTVEAIVGSVQVKRNATNLNSVGPDYSGGAFKLDGAHAFNSSFQTWPFSKRSLQPPCSANGYATLVEVHNVQVLSSPTPGVATYDCRTNYNSSNGNGPLPNGEDCDYVFNVGNATYNCPITCDFHRIYSEIDGDWNASGVAPLPGPTLGATIDIQGFVYWDPDNIINATSHSFTGWEIHPVTAWRIHQSPITASFASNPVAPVVGQPATFTATTTGGTSPYTYTWDFGDGTTAKGASSQVTHTYTSTGSRLVQLFANDTLGSSATSTKNITITNPIVVTVTCGTATAGKPVTCNASATGGTPPYTFTWSAIRGNPETGTGLTFTTTYTVKGTYNLNTTTTDANNMKQSQITSVTVGPQLISVTATCGPATQGHPVTCSASATGGTSPYTISWSSPGSPSSGTGPSYTTTFATNGTYTVHTSVRDANFQVSNVTQSLTVTAKLTAQFRTSPVVVINHSVNFTGSLTFGGIPPYTFSWKFGDGGTGGGVNSTHIYGQVATYNVTLMVTDISGSTANFTQSVQVWKNPDLTGTGGNPDGKDDLFDVALVAFHFGTKQGDPGYDSRYDMNQDGVINIYDVSMVAFYFDTSGW